MEKLEKQTCNSHQGQPLLLFCADDKQKLCLKCVAQHAGHNISDFEDVCQAIIMPKITNKKSFTRETIAYLQRSLIRVCNIERKVLGSSENCRVLLGILNKKGIRKNYVYDFYMLIFYIKKRISEQEEAFMNQLNKISEQTNKFKLLNEPLDNLIDLNSAGKYEEVINLFYANQNEEEMNVQVKNQIKEALSTQITAKDKIKEIESLFHELQSRDYTKLEENIIQVIEDMIKVKAKKPIDDLRHNMPETFFIDEKKHIFKYYDYSKSQIEVKQIASDQIKLPMFTGVGRVAKRIYIFGGKDIQTKEITNKAFELIQDNQELLQIQPINQMIKNRSRSVIASFDQMNGKFSQFLIIVGGSDEFQSLNQCELYYPETDTYYSFPNLNKARENASVCIMNNFRGTGKQYLYCFGGFDKKAIDQIERVEIEFDQTRKHPLTNNKWELVKQATLHHSVECCGSFQLSENEIVIFGGFQKGEDENTQLNSKGFLFQKFQFECCFSCVQCGHLIILRNQIQTQIHRLFCLTSCSKIFSTRNQ